MPLQLVVPPLQNGTRGRLPQLLRAVEAALGCYITAATAGNSRALASAAASSAPALVQAGGVGATTAGEAGPPTPGTTRLNLCNAVNSALRIALETDDRCAVGVRVKAPQSLTSHVTRLPTWWEAILHDMEDGI